MILLRRERSGEKEEKENTRTWGSPSICLSSLLNLYVAPLSYPFPPSLLSIKPKYTDIGPTTFYTESQSKRTCITPTPQKPTLKARVQYTKDTKIPLYEDSAYITGLSKCLLFLFILEESGRRLEDGKGSSTRGGDLKTSPCQLPLPSLRCDFEAISPIQGS